MGVFLPRHRSRHYDDNNEPPDGFELIILIIVASILAILIFSGCGADRNASIPNSTKDVVYIGGINHEVLITEMDGCEYITLDEDLRSLTHKGNCKNPIHK